MEFNLYLLLLVTQWTATQVTTENERTLQSIALILIHVCAITLNSINYNNHSQLTLWMVDSQLTYWFTSSHPFLG